MKPSALGKLAPDFRTISDFRKDNPNALREVFRSFVRLCDRLSQYGKDLIAILARNSRL